MPNIGLDRGPLSITHSDRVLPPAFFTQSDRVPSAPRVGQEVGSGDTQLNPEAWLAITQSMAHAQSQLRLLQQMLGLTPSSGSKQMINEPVFVCIDCEAFEHAQQKITEIGIAVLDTRDVAHLNGDNSQEAWLAKMKYAHYRPTEYAHLRNKTFVKGCPEQFNFGSSTWIKLADVKHVLKRVFGHPSQLQQAGDFSATLSDPDRKVIYVAHGASGDNAYMKQVGFTLGADAEISRTMDTQVLAGGSKKNSIGLHRLLLSLGLDPVNLHNGGNDAAYTLQALVIMALKDLASPGSVFVDLAKVVGKVPPAQRTTRVAPQIWAGTATPPDESNETDIKATSSGPSAYNKVKRRERKRASRAAPNANGTAENAGGASQMLLPAFDRPGSHATRAG